MGWVSTREDILERLDDAQRYFTTGLVNLKAGVGKTSPSQAEIKKLQQQINAFLDDIENRTRSIFDQARERLHDPGVRIVERLNKKENQLTITRASLSESQAQLNKSRQAYEKVKAERDSLLRQQKAAASIIDALTKKLKLLENDRADRAAWESAVSAVGKKSRR